MKHAYIGSLQFSSSVGWMQACASYCYSYRIDVITLYGQQEDSQVRVSPWQMGAYVLSLYVTHSSLID
jgi:hypothetical protein